MGSNMRLIALLLSEYFASGLSLDNVNIRACVHSSSSPLAACHIL